MRIQEFVQQGVNGVNQLSDTNINNGINSTNAGLIQWIVIISVVFFLLIFSMVIMKLLKSIDKFSDAMKDTNIIITRNVENIHEIKTNLSNHANKTDKSFANVHNRINEMSGDLKVVKSNTDVCLKRGVT